MEKLKMDYSKTKIYKIMSFLGDKVYVGSTTKDRLSERMAEHRKNYKVWKAGKTGKTNSFELFEEYGVENCTIILLERYPCNSKDEKNAKEAFYIQSMNCVNRMLPGRTMKQYTLDHRDEIKIKNTNYYITNKDKIRETRKANIFKCECGSSCRRSDRSQHLKTTKHKVYEENK